MHPDIKPVPRGSDLDAKPALGGSNPSASMTTSPADVAILALDQIDWRAPLLTYLLKEVLLPKRTKARQIARCANTFIVLGDELYKRSPSGVLMKCIQPTKGSSSSSRSMPESADITRPQGHWSKKPFIKIFTGPPCYEM